jgi:hypothetical protein
MKQLIIHIKDESTRFLEPIYDHNPLITLVRHNLPAHVMNTLIRCHDQVVMLGHGGPSGLFGPHMHPIIGAENVEALAEKDNNVFIWCHANQFVEKHKLRGFTTSMFISEDAEAVFCLPEDQYQMIYDEHAVYEQNYLFARLVGENIHLPIDKMYANVKGEFVAENIVSDNKSIVEYNNRGLQLFQYVCR